jgi:predicted site-specific integrase-resolvase
MRVMVAWKRPVLDETLRSVPQYPLLIFWSQCATMSKKSRRRGRVLVGYARTSTFDQIAGFDAQHRDLKAAGCTKIFAEQVSSVAQRDQLNAAIDYLREGEAMVATKLDRLASSMRHLIEIVDTVKAKGASFASSA